MKIIGARKEHKRHKIDGYAYEKIFIYLRVSPSNVLTYIIDDGKISMTTEDRHRGYNLRPLKSRTVNIDDNGNITESLIANEVITHDLHLNMVFWEPTIRFTDKRHVWIFRGTYNVGKSFLSSRLDPELLTVYETDASETLPAIITADVIVRGMKYDFKLEDIISRIPDHLNCRIMTVDFTELTQE